jgi:hypothetical protein
MSKPKIFTASIASNSKVKVYNAQTGSLHRIVQLPGGSEIQSGPIVFDGGFSVTVKQGTGTYIITYSFPLCNLKTKTSISS